MSLDPSSAAMSSPGPGVVPGAAVAPGAPVVAPPPMAMAPPPAAPSSKRSVKASKLAKMSEQDRARYLEKRMAEEEESKRRKEEMINAFLRVTFLTFFSNNKTKGKLFISLVQLKLGHEERSFLLNNSKLIERWRVILRQCKNEDLRVDVRTLVDGFSRALDRKTAHIDLLLQVGRSQEMISVPLPLSTLLRFRFCYTSCY